MHTTSIVALLVAVMGAVESANYTCQSLAFIKDVGQANCLGACATAAGGASKALKACKKSCKPASKTLKKPTKAYLKCLSLYFKSVEKIAKKEASITALVKACVATTSDFSKCKIASFVPSSNAKALKKATKADGKWNGKKCVNVLTPSATVCPDPGSHSSSTTTTHHAATGATVGATGGATTHGATTASG